MTHTYPAQTNVSSKPNDRFLDHAAEDFTGSVPSSEQQYRRDLLACAPKPLTDAQQAALIARARTGDKSAREAIVLQLLSSIERYARFCVATYGWACPATISHGELVAAGNLALLETLDQALSKSAPYGYLLRAAKGEMRHYVHQCAGPVALPNTVGATAPDVLSLDAPLDDEENTFLDLFASPEQHVPEQSYEEVGQALARLSEQDRSLVCCLYGLDDHPQLELADLTETRAQSKCLHKRKKRALSRLGKLLSDSFVQSHTSVVTQRVLRTYEQATINEDQQRRLDAAYLQCMAQGVVPSGKRLGQQAHVQQSLALAYLVRLGHTPRCGNQSQVQTRAMQA